MSEMLDFVVQSLKKSDVEKVAKATKISVWTLRKIRIEEIKNPGIKSVEPLYRYFKRLEKQPGPRKSA